MFAERKLLRLSSVQSTTLKTDIHPMYQPDRGWPMSRRICAASNTYRRIFWCDRTFRYNRIIPFGGSRSMTGRKLEVRSQWIIYITHMSITSLA